MLTRRFIAAVFLLVQLAGGLVAPHGNAAVAGALADDRQSSLPEAHSSLSAHGSGHEAGHCADQNSANDSREPSHDECETGCDSCVACIAGLAAAAPAVESPPRVSDNSSYRRTSASGVITRLLRPPAQT